MTLRPRWPDSVASRFALVLIAAILAANIAAVFMLSTDRARVERAFREARDFDRMLELVDLMRAVDPARRDELADVVSSRGARVWVGPAPVADVGSGRFARFSERLADDLGARPQDVRVSVSGNSDQDGRRGGPRRGRLQISVALGDGTWLNTAQRPRFRRDRRPTLGPLLVVMGLSFVSVLVVGLLFVRRLTGPISRLADAAHRAGRGDHEARVPETGAREVRAMAAAFNDMQTRIARFDRDRMHLIGAVGHDLRTPITSLRIRAEMLDDDVREPIVRTLDEMRIMADGLLAFSKGEAGEKSATVDLAALFGRVCDDAGVPFQADAQPLVIGRPVALSRILSNLIGNAARYAGGATVHLAQDGERVLVQVCDEGPGIPPDRLEDMMQPFTRLDASRSAQTGGAGLGLSIARSLARSHGGDLWLQNRPEGGLMATLELPAEAPNG